MMALTLLEVYPLLGHDSLGRFDHYDTGLFTYTFVAINGPVDSHGLVYVHGLATTDDAFITTMMSVSQLLDQLSFHSAQFYPISYEDCV